MKKIFFLFIAITFNFLYGQKYEDVGWSSKFGAAIGYSATWSFPNVEPLNNHLHQLGIGNIAENGIYTSVISGFVYPMFIKNFRIGGIGYSGFTSEKIVQNKFTTEIEYEISGGGITLEYTLPFIRRVGISVGAFIGRGNIEINLYKNTGNFIWDDIWKGIENNDAIKSFNKKIVNKFYVITPTINVDIPLNRFLSGRIGTGWQLTLGENWKTENSVELKNVPKKLNGNLFFINIGIFVGFFAF